MSTATADKPVHIHTEKSRSGLEFVIFLLPIIAFAVVLFLLFQLLFYDLGKQGVQGLSTSAETAENF